MKISGINKGYVKNFGRGSGKYDRCVKCKEEFKMKPFLGVSDVCRKCYMKLLDKRTN